MLGSDVQDIHLFNGKATSKFMQSGIPLDERQKQDKVNKYFEILFRVNRRNIQKEKERSLNPEAKVPVGLNEKYVEEG